MNENENQDKILESLGKRSFREMNINMFILVISFVIMNIVTLMHHPILLPILWLTSLWGVVAGINIVGWLIKAEEWLENAEKKHENKDNTDV